MLSTRVQHAPIVWNQLTGVLNIFKPAGVKSTRVKYTVVGNIIRDLNQMEVREPRKYLSIDLEDDGKGKSEYAVRVKQDLSDHVLAVGPRYQIEDVRCNLVANLGENTSGVLLVGINSGTKEAYKIGKSKLLRVFHVSGKLGISTENNFEGSRIIARNTVTHVGPEKISAMVSSIQASHQKKMFELCGVDPHSQAAFDLAAGGLIRPANNQLPLVYGIKCVHFNRPNFTLEVHSINETETYLSQLVQEIGLQLHTVAYCTGIRCVRHGQFDVESSILRNAWNLQGILDGFQKSRQLIEEHPNMLIQRDGQLIPR